MSPTKVLLPPGELLSYAHDPVELRRLNFQTPGQLSVLYRGMFTFCLCTALYVDCCQLSLKHVCHDDNVEVIF